VNAAKIFESALAQVMREYAALGPSTVIRAWQSLAEDTRWRYNKTTKSDRVMPCVDIRVATPTYDPIQYTIVSEAQIIAWTEQDDDPDHAIISGMYGELQGVARKLINQSISGTDGDELTRFKALIAAGSAEIVFGGIVQSPGVAPYGEDGLNAEAFGLFIHWSEKP
jgi:hypothetical protein